MSELAKIQEQIAKLQAQADDLIQRERKTAIEQIRDLMQRYRISAAELSSGPQPTGNRRKPAVKYRDPASGKTWTGRGRRPAWVADTMAV